MVCNEINPFTHAALADNIATALIATPIAAVAQHVVNLMAATIAAPSADSSGLTFLPFDIYVSENI